MNHHKRFRHEKKVGEEPSEKKKAYPNFVSSYQTELPAAFSFRLRTILLIASICVIMAVGLKQHRRIPLAEWWKYHANGQILYPPQFAGLSMIIGDASGMIHSVEYKTGQEQWTYQMQESLGSPILSDTVSHALYITSEDGTLYSLASDDGREIWRRTNENKYKYSSPVLRDGILYITDASSTVYALDSRTGMLRWKRVLLDRGVVSDGTLGTIIYDEELLIYTHPQGFIVAFDPGGNIRWRKTIGDPIVSQNNYDRYLVVGTKSGAIELLQTKNGSVIWEEKERAEISCFLVDEVGLQNSVTRTGQEGNAIHSFISLLTHPHPPVLIVASNDDVLTAREFENGRKVWEKQIRNKIVSCPHLGASHLYVPERSRIEILRTYDGESQSSFSVGNGSIFLSGITPSQSSSFAFWRRSEADLLIYDDSSTVYRFDPEKKKILWSFNIPGNIKTFPISFGHDVVIVTTEGSVYRIDAASGQVYVPYTSIHINQHLQQIGQEYINEITIETDQDPYNNPWQDVQIQAIFHSPEGKDYFIDGFYFDKNTWKVRFNPPVKGLWKWDLTFNAGNNARKENGSFISLTSSVHPRAVNNGQHLTIDGKTIFNGIGLQDVLKDKNNNTYPLDNFYMFSEQFDSLLPASKGRFFTLDEYLQLYRDNGFGFNMFRWSINNASFNLWKNFTLTNSYSIMEGKYGDDLAQSVKQHGYVLWLTFFGFSIPYQNSMLEDEARSLKDYIRYVVARYGAYADIWEIANEAKTSDYTTDLLAAYLKHIDPEKRLISMSDPKPNLESIDIISPHWYESESPSESDLRLLDQVKPYQMFKKPIIFGEQGNKDQSWDDRSGERMRIRSWTAFFNEIMLIFWNQPDSKTYYNPTFNNANIYLGIEERGYVEALQKFTKGFDLSAKKVPIEVDSPEVRGYGLASDREFAAYLFHFSNPDNPLAVSVRLPERKKGTLIWYDPSTGKELGTQKISESDQYIYTPEFRSDLAVKLIYDKTDSVSPSH